MNQNKEEDELSNQQITKSFNNTSDVFNYFARRSKMMASIEPKFNQYDNGKQFKQKFDKVKTSLLNKDKDKIFEPYEEKKEMFKTNYRENYNEQNQEQNQKLFKQNQLIQINNRFLMNKSNNDLILIKQQQLNKENMIKYLQEQQEFDQQSQVSNISQFRKNKSVSINNNKELQQFVRTGDFKKQVEDQYYKDDKFKMALDSLSNFMVKSKIANKQISKLSKIGSSTIFQNQNQLLNLKQEIQEQNNDAISEEEEEIQKDDEKENKQIEQIDNYGQEQNCLDKIESTEQLIEYIFQNKQNMNEYLGQYISNQDSEKIKEFIIKNEKYIKHLAGLCRCFNCTCRHCRCEQAIKFTNNLKNQSDYKTRYKSIPLNQEILTLDDNLYKLIEDNSRGSLMNHKKKSFYHDSVQQVSYKQIQAEKDPRHYGHWQEVIPNNPQLVQQSSYQANYQQSIQTVGDHMVDKRKTTFGTQQRGKSHYKSEFQIKDQKDLTHKMINTCVPLNAVKSQLIDQTTNLKDFNEKIHKKYQNFSGKYDDNFVVYPKQYTTWNRHFQSLASIDYQDKQINPRECKDRH